MQKIVTNNKACNMQIQLSHGLPRVENGKVKAPPLAATMIQLVPGLNLVDAGLWEEAKKLRVVQLWLKTRIQLNPAEEARGEKVGSTMLEEGPDVPGNSPLEGKDPQACEQLIDAVEAPEFLKRWLGEEKRQDIRLMLDARIKFLETGGSIAPTAGQP